MRISNFPKIHLAFSWQKSLPKCVGLGKLFMVCLMKKTGENKAQANRDENNSNVWYEKQLFVNTFNAFIRPSLSMVFFRIP